MTEREQLEQVIAHLEAQRTILGEATVEAALAPMREKLAALKQAEAPQPALAGERKLVTIMFADISGFTAMAETMDPEAVRDMMNACFEQLVPIVGKYGGTVDKFIGDEIMALFGAPVAHENDPERALRAALEMMEALARFNTERHTDLGLHFGLNTGLVIAGGIGTHGRQDYSVMGDAVNLAARLEDASERGQIFVGPDTYRLVAPLFEFEALEPIRVKGKAEPVAIYRLLAAKAVPGKSRGIAGLESPLVGRQTEFRALGETVERLRSGGGGIVTLVGEAGLGKSRLVAELQKQVAQQQIEGAAQLQWIEGRCLSYGASIAYLLWLDLLRGLLEVTPDDAPATVRDVLHECVQTLCPKHIDEVFPYLGWLMSLPLEEDVKAMLQDLEGQTLKTATFRAVETLLESAAWQRPLVVVCEDLHWADPTSIELAEQLLPLTDRAPLLLVCIFRPETEHDCWRVRETAARHFHHCHTDLWLEPLSTAESKTLVSNLLRVEDLPRELGERILSRAEGNPFFVEEIIRSLIDSTAIVHDEATNGWQASQEIATIDIPDTLHGVLAARIDRLQEETKRVLQLASVIGRLFLYRVLATIAREERKLDTHLLTLQQEEMIRERARLPELEYIFKHHLTQEAAYNGLLKQERRVFHRQVAEALERLFPERIEEQVGLLAHHWERAGEPEKAVEYLLRAGDQARLAYTHQEAIDYYQRALVVLKAQEDYDRAARTQMKLGLTHHNAFDFRQARRAYEESFELWQTAGEMEPVVPPPAPHALRLEWDEPRRLDPARIADAASGKILDLLFSGLVEESPQLDVMPDVAQSWEILDGGRKYIFHLRDDVYWSDGTPVTAADFEYAWRRVLAPATESPSASLLYDVKGARAFHQGEVANPDKVGVRALDDVTLEVELEGPTGYFLHLLICQSIYPVPQHIVETYGEAWTAVENIVTDGPFRLETWKRGKLMILSRNPEYHGHFTGNVERIELTLQVRWDWSATLKLYEADGLDMVELPPSPELNRARQQYTGDYLSVPKLKTYYLSFDVSQPPFDDRRVRRAFALAIDREMYADQVTSSAVAPATGGFIPPGMPGHSAGIGLPYDPVQARCLLAEAGYPEGHGLPVGEWLIYSGHESLAEYLQEQWRENLGVEVTWKVPEFMEFFDRLEKDPPPMWLTGWIADYADPDNFLRVCLDRSCFRWRNETYERLVEEARRVTDQGMRMKLYQQADRILVEEAAILPLTYYINHSLVKPWLSKFPVSPTKSWFPKDVIIEPH